MAESVVSFLLPKLSSLLEEEVNILSGFRKEVVYVKDELERMRAFLRAADAVEDEDEEIKVWVKQVREVSYDTEDILDEFLFRFEYRHQHGFYGYLCKMARAIKNLKARHQLAYKLQSIKTRVTNISEGHQRYRYKLNTTEIGSSSDNSAGNKMAWHAVLRSDARLLDEAQLVGVDLPKQNIVSWLVEDVSGLRVAVVVGMGGLGKTTLVSKVYDEMEVKKHFQHHAWVTVSQTFKLDELLRQIIRQLFDQIRQPLPQGANSTDNYILKTIIIDFLRGKRYLLVLDDIWSVDEWDAVKMAFPNDNNGSRLMITTRISEVASFSTKDLGGRIFPLTPLSLEESWTLFCVKTFQGDQCPHHLEKICRNVLRRCEGLPLAIVAIGGMLATKDITKIEEWEMVDRCLGAELEGNKRLKGMNEILLLSFNDLSYHLKYCFMYLSIFPEDYLIRRRMLIRLWIAEGFVQEIEGRTLEEVGDGYFNELLNRSLIQVACDRIYSTSGKITHCRVHDLFREIILLKSKDQKFAAIANDENKIFPDRVRRLSVHKGTNIDACGDNRLSGLRSVLCFGREDDVLSNSLSSFFNNGARLLKVLDCNGTPLSTFPKDITKLYHLRYLSLRNTNIRSIPRSIGKLQNLETLDLKNTFVQELPIEISELQRLQHVIVYRNNSRLSTERIHGFKALKGIETLSSLRKLCYIDANPGGANLLISIGRLTQLTMLGILQLGEEYGHALCSSIEKLKYLRSLSLDSRNENEILDVQSLSPSSPQFLQRLHMRGRLEMLPQWLPNLTNLVKLVFKFSRLQVDPLESLQALPNLLLLVFDKGSYDGKELCFKAGGFAMLNHFSIVQADRLSSVRVEEGAMPRLENLWLEDCKLLKEIPSGVENLSKLNRLGLVNMSDELTRTIYSESQDENHLRVKHVPSVFIGQRTTEDGFSGHFL